MATRPEPAGFATYHGTVFDGIEVDDTGLSPAYSYTGTATLQMVPKVSYVIDGASLILPDPVPIFIATRDANATGEDGNPIYYKGAYLRVAEADADDGTSASDGIEGIRLTISGNPDQWGWTFTVKEPGHGTLNLGLLSPLTVGADYTAADLLPVPGTASPGVTQGAPGESAYQVAVANGFEGTETDWLASLHGTAGDDGAAATVTVGSTTTSDPGTEASVTNSGTSAAAVLDFAIPRGDDGPAAHFTVTAVSVSASDSPSWTVTGGSGTDEDPYLATLNVPAGAPGAMGASLTPAGAYDADTTYTQGQVVSASDDNLYASLADANTGNDPTSTTGSWVILNGTVPSWADITGSDPSVNSSLATWVATQINNSTIGLEVTDNGNGTVSLDGPMVVDNGDGTISVGNNGTTVLAPVTADTWHTVGATGEPVWENSWSAAAEGSTFTRTLLPDGRYLLDINVIATHSGAISAGTEVIIFQLPAGYFGTDAGYRAVWVDNSAKGVLYLETDGGVGYQPDSAYTSASEIAAHGTLIINPS